MTYLSRIRINPLRAESRELLGSPRAMHAAVMGGVADRPTTERTLWRLDADNPRRPMLFVLTESKPDWTHVVERAGWPDADGEHAAIRDYTPLLAQIAVGREFAFRLTASPVQNTSKPLTPTPIQAERMSRGQTRSFRIGHRTASAQLNWFFERTGSWGFEVPESVTSPPARGLVVGDHGMGASPHGGTAGDRGQDGCSLAREVRIIARERRSFAKNGRGAPVVLHTATFEGHLRVTDHRLFRERLIQGIGPSKAYGCGLLTLAPLRRRSPGDGDQGSG